MLKFCWFFWNAEFVYGSNIKSKAISSNLFYQFFGKVNDPDPAKYYEPFFELIKIPTKSISRSSGLSLEIRITKREKEVAKRRASIFFRLKHGEFVAFADGKDRKVRFRLLKMEKNKPKLLRGIWNWTCGCTLKASIGKPMPFVTERTFRDNASKKFW